MFDESLILNIFNLINYYYSNSKDIDLDFIKKIISFYSNAYNLSQYIKEITITNNNEIAAYNRISGIIKINPQLANRHNESQTFFNEKENNWLKYLNITQILLHESEHANQKRKVKENQSIEAAILVLTDFINSLPPDINSYEYLLEELRKTNKNYLNTWDCNPSERLAEYFSYSLILEIIKRTNNLNLLTNYFKSLLNFKLLIPYIKFNQPPIKTCLNSLNLSENMLIIENLLKNNKLPDYVLFVLGMPLKDEVLNQYKNNLTNNIQSLKRKK